MKNEKKEYYRLDEILREEASDDSSLQSLIVDGYILEPNFDKNTYKYSLNIIILVFLASAQTTPPAGSCVPAGGADMSSKCGVLVTGRGGLSRAGA